VAFPLPDFRGPMIRSVAEVDVALRRVLLDAARDAEKLLEQSSSGVGRDVSQAQLLAVYSELRELSHALWGDRIPEVIARLIAMAEQRAHANADAIDRVIANATGQADIRSAMRSSMRQRARRVIDVFRTRERSAKFELSQNVWKWESWHNSVVERTIAAAFARGASAREISQQVKGFISPDTPGGAAYAAKRLGRTEVANAYHRQTISDYIGNPYVTGLQWKLSHSHPGRDVCNDLATGHSRGMAAGVYRATQVPDKPHPQCLCHTIPVVISEEDFQRGFLDGGFNNDLLTRFPDIDPGNLPPYE
jgi:hypothetical protein